MKLVDGVHCFFTCFFFFLNKTENETKTKTNQQKKKAVEPDLDGSVLLTIYTKWLRRCQ